jgi:hypothetical protein
MKTELSKPSLTKARYNHTRLHSSLDYESPITFASQTKPTLPLTNCPYNQGNPNLTPMTPTLLAAAYHRRCRLYRCCDNC